MPRNLQVLVLILGVALCAAYGAEEEPSAGKLPKDVITPDGILLRFDQAEMSQVVDLYGRLTGRVVIPSPELKGKVTILNRTRVDRETAARLIESALELQGWVVLLEGNIAKLVKTRDAVKRQMPMVTTNGRSPALAGINRMQTHIVPLKWSKAEDVKNLISPLLSNEGSIQVNPRTNLLVVTEIGTNMARLLELIDRVERPLNLEEEYVQGVQLRFVDPKKMVADIKEYFKDSTLNFLPNDRLQLLVLSGKQVEVKKALLVIAQLDRPIDNAATENQIIRIQYAKALEIADLLVRLYKGRADAPAPTFSVNADKSSNTLIITGPPELRAEIKHLVSEIDKRYEQVLLKVLIGEANNRPSRDLGVQWQYLRGATEVVQDFGSIGASVDRSAIRTSTPGFRYSVIHPLGYSSFIQAIEASGAVDILAAPQVMVANNKTAILNIGDRVPVVTAQRISDNSNTVVNQNEFVETGITIKATPAITPGREVSLDLDFKFSEIGVQLSANVNPTFSNRQATTNVIVKDNHTLILAGLMRRDHNRTETRIPYFARLPVLGPLFRNRSDKNLKQELILMITPTVIERSVESDEVTTAYNAVAFKDTTHHNYRERFLEFEKHSNQLDQIPGPIKPAFHKKGEPPLDANATPNDTRLPPGIVKNTRGGSLVAPSADLQLAHFHSSPASRRTTVSISVEGQEVPLFGTALAPVASVTKRPAPPPMSPARAAVAAQVAKARVAARETEAEAKPPAITTHAALAPRAPAAPSIEPVHGAPPVLAPRLRPAPAPATAPPPFQLPTKAKAAPAEDEDAED